MQPNKCLNIENKNKKTRVAQFSKANGPKVAHFPQGKHRKWGGENSQPVQAGATYPQVTLNVDHSSLELFQTASSGEWGKGSLLPQGLGPGQRVAVARALELWRTHPPACPQPRSSPISQGPGRPRVERRHSPLTALSASRTTLKLTVSEAGPLNAAITVT